LKFLSEYLDLSTATISVVLNDSPTWLIHSGFVGGRA
jgi:hypothetical protein